MTEYIISFIEAMIRMSVPLTFAALGEVACERSGIINIGIEGSLLSGAFFGYLTTYHSGSLILGFLAGIAQGFTVISGISHSAVMLSAGILLGFNKRLAIRYAYLMSIPCIIGALIIEIMTLDETLITPDYLGMCAIGTLCSLLIGVLFIQRLLRYIRTRSFTQFAYYNFLIGAVIIVLNFTLTV